MKLARSTQWLFLGILVMAIVFAGRALVTAAEVTGAPASAGPAIPAPPTAPAAPGGAGAPDSPQAPPPAPGASATPAGPASPAPASPAPASSAQASPAPSASPASSASPAGSSDAQGGQGLPEGFKIEDLKVGDGPSPQNGSRVVVHYEGWLTDGKKFDSSIDRNMPFEFIFGEGMVIKGWEVGMATMKKGGKRRLTIPPEMAYGEFGSGPVPPKATLIFEVQLLDIKDH